jgi:HSP20 family protein
MERTRRPHGRNAEQIQSSMEEVFRALVNRQRALPGRAGDGWRPHLEVYETAEALVVRAELAGVAADTLDVTLEEQLLLIRGQRRPAADEERRVYHRMDISYGPFVAEIFIPFPVEPERVGATYDDGILEVRLPKVPRRRIVPQTVRIETGVAPSPAVAVEAGAAGAGELRKEHAK